MAEQHEILGGIVKRSLAMAFLGCGATIAKAFGLDDATPPDCHFFVVHPRERRSDEAFYV